MIRSLTRRHQHLRAFSSLLSQQQQQHARRTWTQQPSCRSFFSFLGGDSSNEFSDEERRKQVKRIRPSMMSPTTTHDEGGEGDVMTMRDSMPDVRGVRVVTRNFRCLEHFDLAVWDFSRWSGDPVSMLQKAIDEDHECILAHCLLGLHALIRQGGLPTHPQVISSLREIRRLLASGCGSDREVVHAAALEAIATDDLYGAVAIWEQWLLREPLDLMALRAVHEVLLILGDGRAALESVARSRPHWGPRTPGFGQVMAMHAFALTENTLTHSVSEEAEMLASAAWNKDKNDAWALHALCHIYEHGGRANEGESLLRNSRDFWEALPDLHAAIHFGSHYARFYLERGNYKAALRALDTAVMEPLFGEGVRQHLGLVKDIDDEDGELEVAKMDVPGTERLLHAPTPTALTDATALLIRMELCSVAGAYRWKRVNDRWEIVCPSYNLSVDENDEIKSSAPVMIIHRLNPLEATHRTIAKVIAHDMSSAGVSGESIEEQSSMVPIVDDSNQTLPVVAEFLPVAILKENRSPYEDGIEWMFDEMYPAPQAPRALFCAKQEDAPREVVDDIAQQVGKALVQYWRNDMRGVVDLLLPLKTKFHLLGGSVVDSEIPLLTLIEATLRSKEIEGEESTTHGAILARALLAERTALKAGSAQSWLRYSLVLHKLGDTWEAARARHHAYALGIGQGGKGSN